MTVTLQVVYQKKTDGAETTFDFQYYLDTHIPLVQQHLGGDYQGITASQGIAGGPDVPPAIWAIATLSFADMAALDTALGKAGPVLADIRNFYKIESTVDGADPQMLIGETIV